MIVYVISFKFLVFLKFGFTQPFEMHQIYLTQTFPPSLLIVVFIYDACKPDSVTKSRLPLII